MLKPLEIAQLAIAALHLIVELYKLFVAKKK